MDQVPVAPATDEPVRAPSTEELRQLEADLGALEADLDALDELDAPDDGDDGSAP